MTQLLAWLEGIHPALPWGIVTLALWLAQYAVRRWLPHFWEKAADIPFPPLYSEEGMRLIPVLVIARKVWQGLPSVLFGALAGALMHQADPRAAWLGALAGAVAPVWHEALKAFPWLPYRGETKT